MFFVVVSIVGVPDTGVANEFILVVQTSNIMLILFPFPFPFFALVVADEGGGGTHFL